MANKFSNGRKNGDDDGDELDALSAFALGTSLNKIIRTEKDISEDIVDSLFFVPGVKEELTSKFGEISLKQLLETSGLPKHILSTNTFIYGKVGFYRTILDTIHAQAKVEPEKYVYLSRSSDLKRKTNDDVRLILLPTASTVSALNSFISQSLNKNGVVWLVSYPSTTAKHVMLNFRNFFIAGSTETEIAPLRDILKISDDDYRYLTSTTQGGALFVSDFKAFGESTFVKRIRLA